MLVFSDAMARLILRTRLCQGIGEFCRGETEDSN